MSKGNEVTKVFHEAAVAHSKGDLVEAEGGYRAYLSVISHDGHAARELGRLLSGQKRYAEARQVLLNAIAFAPSDALTLGNLGGVLSLMGEHDESGYYLRKVLQIAPYQHSAMWNYALHQLKEACTGSDRDDCWSEGWDRYRWRRPINAAPTRTLIKDWNGEITGNRWNAEGKFGSPLNDGTLFLSCEQGFGDTMMFARFVPIVREHWQGKILLEVQGGLLSLIQHQEWAQGLTLFPQMADGSIPYPADVHCNLLDLIHTMGLGRSDVPTKPYLRADPLKVAGYNDRMTPGLRVGLCWGGNPDHPNSQARDVGLEGLAPLNEMLQSGAYPGLSFECVQMGAERQKLGDGFQLSDTFHAWDDTAAAVANLDLLITADTGIAHLAGAMGKPVWLMIPVAADWRWGKSGQSSLWYPSAVIFRQETPGDWVPVIDTIAERLKDEYSAWCKAYPDRLAEAIARTEEAKHVAEMEADAEQNTAGNILLNAPIPIPLKRREVPMVDVDAMMADLNGVRVTPTRLALPGGKKRLAALAHAKGK